MILAISFFQLFSNFFPQKPLIGIKTGITINTFLMIHIYIYLNVQELLISDNENCECNCVSESLSNSNSDSCLNKLHMILVLHLVIYATARVFWPL